MWGNGFSNEAHTMSETAKKRKFRTISRGGLEGSLDRGGFIVLLLGLLAGVWFLIMGGFKGILPATFVVVLSYWFRLVLRALAENIRLQKKSLGLNYGGQISEVQSIEIHVCSVCGEILHSDSRCESCGSTLDGDE